MSNVDPQNRLVEWFRRWRTPLRRFLASRNAVRPADFDDVAQEVFLRLLRYDAAQIVEHPQAYLFKMVSNVAAEWSIRASNRLHHEPHWLATLATDEASPERVLDSEVAQLEVLRALNTLSPRERTILFRGGPILGAWFALGLRGDVIESKLAERRQVMLEDGTVVQLEPETRLRVTYDEKLRRVQLEHGRALFRVAKNAQRPFLVSADQTSVRAVGTAFGVETASRGVVVTVAEGKVAVADSQKARSSGNEIFLVAGQQVVVADSGSVAAVRAVDTTRALAWAQGQLVFENDTLAAVVEEFNRYNRVQLSIADAQLAARKVSGVFDATDSETLLAFIRQSGDEVDITRTDAGIVIGTLAQ